MPVNVSDTKSREADLKPQRKADVRNFKYSVVVPVFNGADTLGELIERTATVFENRQCNYEIVIVNDGSTDNSWAFLESAVKQNHNVIAIDLVKNYGQHAALLCGLKHSSGDYVITIDSDLQNPPEEIFKLIDRIGNDNLDLIFARFEKKRHSFVRRMGSLVIGLLNEKIFAKPKDLKVTNVRLMSRELVSRICRYPTAFPYINGLALKFSRPDKRANVTLEHHERATGKSTYNIGRITTLVFTILFNYSSYPLVLVSTIGFTVAALSFGLGLAVIVKRVFFHALVPGWASIVVLMAFFNGILTLLLGMLGEYMVRILNTVSNNSSYEVGSVLKSE